MAGFLALGSLEQSWPFGGILFRREVGSRRPRSQTWDDGGLGLGPVAAPAQGSTPS